MSKAKEFVDMMINSKPVSFYALYKYFLSTVLYQGFLGFLGFYRKGIVFFFFFFFGVFYFYVKGAVQRFSQVKQALSSNLCMLQLIFKNYTSVEKKRVFYCFINMH